MQNRFALRFESGERRGETVAVPADGLTLGRRPGNSVQILDASVSGRHAEVVIDGDGLLLRDLGSTNGTRVGGERISEQRLSAGDELLLGNVRMTLVDTAPAPSRDLAHSDTGEIELELEDDPAPAPRPAAAVPAAPVQPRSAPAPARPAPAAREASPPARDTETDVDADEAGEAVQTISAERVARSRGGPMALIALLVVLGGGAAAAWFLLRGQGGEGGGGPALRAVEPIEGDLLAAGYSFEEDRGGWESEPRATAGFALDGAARRSGEVGLLAELQREPDEPAPWALEQSPAVRVAGGRALSARAWLEAEGGAELALGVRLESSSGAAQPVVFWDAPLADASEGREFVVDVPPAYDRARALLLARLAEGAEEGVAGADDVALVPVPAPAGRPKLGETELFASGSTAVLFKIDRALLSGLAFAPSGRAGDPAAPRAQLEALSEENGLRLLAPKAQGAQVLAFFVESGLAAGGLASTGTGGYRTHQVEFEREGAEALLVGRGRDLVRVACPGARVVRGQPSGGGFRVEVEFDASAEVFVQTSFSAERDAAQTLARQARRAEEQGRLGETLSAWGRVLDEYPYEESLVREAETSRGRLEQAGHAELRDLEVRLERARFFRLMDIFRRCRDDAQALAARYEPSGVADEARALIAQIDADSAGLSAELDAAERARLAAIEAALRESGSTQLAERVARRLAELGSKGMR